MRCFIVMRTTWKLLVRLAVGKSSVFSAPSQPHPAPNTPPPGLEEHGTTVPGMSIILDNFPCAYYFLYTCMISVIQNKEYEKFCVLQLLEVIGQSILEPSLLA